MDQKHIGEVIQEVMQLRMGMPDRMGGWDFEADSEPELFQVLVNDNYGIKMRQMWFPRSVRQSVTYRGQVVFENHVPLGKQPLEASHYIPGAWEEEVRRIYLVYNMQQERRA